MEADRENCYFGLRSNGHDFEAWLLPFWDRIQELAKYKKSPPSGKPEQVNHHKPPSKHIQEIFEIGKCRDSYSKTRMPEAY